jgi:hypothetical protein
MTHQTNDFNPFEARLEAAFRPVRPSNKYVQAMRQRINSRTKVKVVDRMDDPPALLFILGGVLSVSLLIITTARAIFYLANRSRI